VNAPSARAIDVIINVDDIGLHPAVRRAVEDCAAHGSVTSASVLANGPDIDAIRPYPGITLGAHLNILRGTPLSPRAEVRTLVGADGNFLGSFAKLAWRAARGTLDLDEVRLEWSRQVAFLRERGLELTHADGEKHTHCLPGLFAVACDVAREHGIAWIRRSDERFTARGSGTDLAGRVRRSILRALCENARTPAGLRSADAVWGIANQGSALSAEACARALEPVERAVIEIVCHPGKLGRDAFEIPASFGRMRVTQLWEPEYQILRHGSWLAVAAQQGWRLRGFDAHRG